jgi:hypothetical protein
MNPFRVEMPNQHTSTVQVQYSTAQVVRYSMHILFPPHSRRTAPQKMVAY